MVVLREFVVGKILRNKLGIKLEFGENKIESLIKLATKKSFQ